MYKKESYMLIEIVGNPGSGKSTLITELQNKVKSDSFFWGRDKLKLIKYYISSTKNKSRKKLNFLFKLPLANLFFARVYLQRIKYTPEMHTNEWGELSQYVITGVIQNNKFPVKTKPHYINWELEKMIRSQIAMNYVRETKSNIYLDEGVVTVLAAQERSFSELSVKTLLDLVVYLDTSVKEIFYVGT